MALLISPEAAKLDRHRLLAWIASWGALSAAWQIEEKADHDTAIKVAEIAINEISNTAIS